MPPAKKPKLQAVDDEKEIEQPGQPDEVETETKAETNGKIEMAMIPFRGKTFAIPKDMDEWQTEACLAMGQSDYVLAAKLLLGSGQWALLQSLGNKRKDIRAFLLVFADVVDKECTG